MTNRVIDERARGWLWLDNAVIDEYAAVIGPYALAVYTALCRHADANGQAFPSVPTLAKKLGMSPNTVRKAIGTLVEQRLITCESRQDQQGDAMSNLYTLLSVGGTAPHEVPHAMQEGTAPDEVRVLHGVKGNKTQLNKTHGTRIAPHGAPPNREPKTLSEKPNQTPPVPNHPPRPPRSRTSP